MDLRRHLDVIVRHRRLIAAGVLLGVALAAVALLRIGPSGVEWREREQWASVSVLHVTQQGFPEGRVLADIDDSARAPGRAPAAKETGPAREQPGFFADPGRFSGLALLYAYLLSGQEVEALMGPQRPGSEVIARRVTAGSGSRAESLPLLEIETRTLEAKGAVSLNHRAIDALRTFVERRQIENDVTAPDRVRLDVLQRPGEPKVAIGRSYTPAIVLFLLASMLAVAIAYLVENLRRPPAHTRDELEEALAPPRLEAVGQAREWT